MVGWLVSSWEVVGSVQTCTYVSRKLILCPFSVQAGLLPTGNWWRHLPSMRQPSLAQPGLQIVARGGFRDSMKYGIIYANAKTEH